MRPCLHLALSLLLAGCPAPPSPPADLVAPDLVTGTEDLAEAELAGVDLRMTVPPDLAAPPDPGRPGPSRVLRFDLRVPLSPAASLETTVLGPTQDGMILGPGPYPLVVFSPGFTLPRGQFSGYAERLASHGFVVVLQTARAEANHSQYRDDTVKLIDWFLAPTGGDAGKVQGRADPGAIGIAGHSLGGKIAFLVAGKDARVKAVIGVDPVDSGFGMQPAARDALPAIRLPAGTPLGFLGQTVSKAGAFPCTPPGQNFEALYAAAPSPAFAITFVGAAHNDFVDDFNACAQCWVCSGGTAPKTRTRDLAVKYVAAYFLRYLKGIASAEDALSGAAFEADRAAGAVTRQAK